MLPIKSRWSLVHREYSILCCYVWVNIMFDKNILVCNHHDHLYRQ